MSGPDPALALILNSSKYHREHENLYARHPLKQALELHDVSRMLKSLADRWTDRPPATASKGNPYRCCEGLNEASTIQHMGLPFMESEGEPSEIVELKRRLEVLRLDLGGAGAWAPKTWTPHGWPPCPWSAIRASPRFSANGIALSSTTPIRPICTRRPPGRFREPWTSWRCSTSPSHRSGRV